MLLPALCLNLVVYKRFLGNVAWKCTSFLTSNKLIRRGISIIIPEPKAPNAVPGGYLHQHKAPHCYLHQHKNENSEVQNNRGRVAMFQGGPPTDLKNMADRQEWMG